MSQATADSGYKVGQRTLVFALGAIVGLALLVAVALWAKLGTAVFFEVIAAGIAYCF